LTVRLCQCTPLQFYKLLCIGIKLLIIDTVME
jgi:hypothetical protein